MDLYTILGLARGATVVEIKRAYRRLARRYHPDINPGDGAAAARFRQIAEAYETLSDPDRRRTYDAGPVRDRQESVSYGFAGFDFSMRVQGETAPTFGDLFAEVFHRRESGLASVDAERGADLHSRVSISFEESLVGLERPVTVTRRVRCHTCGGSGVVSGPELHCVPCGGSGTIRSTRSHMVFSKPCPRCRGTGRHRQTPCSSCAAQGVEARSETIVVQIPPGITDGARIRVPGRGNIGLGGGESGDLYITTDVEPHPLFRREGDDLHLVVPVAIHEAALGAKIEVPTTDGPARLRVPPGTQSGQRFRLRDRGAPSPRDGRRGDLVVEVRLVLPRLLDERSKELLREFGRINDESVRKFS